MLPLSDIVDLPWMADLPRLSGWVRASGDRKAGPRPRSYQRLPTLATNRAGSTDRDIDRSLALGLRRRCSMCGCEMVGPVYSVQISTNGNYVWEHLPGDLHTTQHYPGPMHRSCAFAAVLFCPFLKHATSHRRVEDVTRGDAAVVGFCHYGLYFTPRVISYNRYRRQRMVLSLWPIAASLIK